MSTRKALLARLARAAFGSIGASPPTTPKLGKPITEADIAAWDIAAMPDGTGLPPGSGTAVQGAKCSREKCVACHGEGGKGGARRAAAGRRPAARPAASTRTKTIGNFCGNATTLFDFTAASMPFDSRGRSRDNEVYALTAYILFAQQDHRRERRDGRQDPAAGEDAEPGQFHHRVSGSDLNEVCWPSFETRMRVAALMARSSG